MTDAVHHSLALDDQGHVDVGKQYPLAFPQWRHQVDAFGRNDCGMAAAGYRALQASIRGDGFDLRLAQPAGGVDDETAGFGGMVAHRGVDLVGKHLADH